MSDTEQRPTRYSTPLDDLADELHIASGETGTPLLMDEVHDLLHEAGPQIKRIFQRIERETIERLVMEIDAQWTEVEGNTPYQIGLRNGLQMAVMVIRAQKPGAMRGCDEYGQRDTVIRDLMSRCLAEGYPSVDLYSWLRAQLSSRSRQPGAALEGIG